jgi:hypothetical protein
MDIEIISAIISSVSIIVGSMIIPTISILYQKHKNKVKNKNISIFRNKIEEVRASVENIKHGFKTKDIQEIVDKSAELEVLYKNLSRNGCQEYKNSLIFWFDYWDSFTDFCNILKNSDENNENLIMAANKMLRYIRRLSVL